MSALVARPTETAAIGRCRPKPLPPASIIRDSLAGAKHRADRYGAVLLGAMLIHVTTVGQVGER